MSLESVGKLVAQHSGVIAASPAQTKLDKVRAEQQIVKYMFRWISIGMIILGIGALMLVLNKNFDFGKIFGLISTFLVLGGTGCAAFGVLSAISKGASLAGTGSARQLPQANEQVLPTAEFPAALPSVTERTTQLIRSSGTEQEQEVK